MLNIKDFGAVADGKTVNTKAIQAAVDAAGKTGEAILIPTGVFVTGTINLNGVSVHMETGSVLKGSTNIDDYPAQDFIHNEMGALRAMLINRDHDNVTIDGCGTIDLSGTDFYDKTTMNVPQSRVPFTKEQEAECTYPIGTRPNQCIFFHNSKNVSVRGINVIDAPCWTFSFNECENVKLLGLTIDTSLNVPNDDGIHIASCKGVIIANCNISSGDDCIALSGITDWARPCEDIVITNCVLRSCSKAFVIGYSYSHIRNVTITNCIIKESNRGICFMCNDTSALVENVRISNMIVETVCLLSKLNVDHHIEVEIKMDELDLTAAEKKATYEEIREYVLEHTGLKVSNLYIAQVKQKCGIIERENYNKPKSENSKQPKCPPEKEAAIMEALKHFQMMQPLH